MTKLDKSLFDDSGELRPGEGPLYERVAAAWRSSKDADAALAACEEATKQAARNKIDAERILKEQFPPESFMQMHRATRSR
jgi:hypothetical protein